jgi:hypothetical protein
MRTTAARPSALAILAVCVIAGAPACATYHDDLLRAREAFDQSSYERALGLFRAIENDTAMLTSQERAQYAYLRGMTDYRLGYRADARHWLLVCKMIDDGRPGTLSQDWRTRLDETLTELNEQVYAAGGTQGLENKLARPGEKPKPKNPDEP